MDKKKLIWGILILSLVVTSFFLIEFKDILFELDETRLEKLSSESSFSQIEGGDISIQSKDKSWTVTKSTGTESQLTFWTLNAKDKKTELGWLPPDNSCTGWTDKYLYNELGERILDDKDKEILLKCESAKCGGRNCYHISLTNAQAVNIDEYVQLGNNTIITEYQDINLINYQSNWFDVNVTLFINLNNDWNNTINNIFVFDNPTKKFGANVSNYNTTQEFKYIVESTDEIKKEIGYRYYISRAKTTRLGSVSGTEEERHYFDFKDICSVKTNESGIVFSPNCSFTYQDEQTLEITFYAEYNSTLDIISIDPTITIDNVNSYGSINNNVTTEAYPSAHISTNDSSLLLYMPFNTPNRSSTVYDYTDNNLDGTLAGNAMTNESGWIGGGLQLDGTTDYISMGDVDSLDQPSSFTFSLWINIADTSFNGLVTKRSGGGWVFAVFDDDTLSIFDDQWRYSTGKVSFGVWNHVAVSYNGTNYMFYINGSSAGTTASGTMPDSGVAPLQIGAWDGSSYVPKGIYDEVMIFNRSLTASEMLDIYNNQTYRFNTPASQGFKTINIEQNGSLNRINITTNSTQLMGTSMQVRLNMITQENYSTSVLPYIPEMWYRFDNVTGENETVVTDFGSRSLNISFREDYTDVSLDSPGYFKSRRFIGYNDGSRNLTSGDRDFTNNISIIALINLTDKGGYIISKSEDYVDVNTDHEWGFLITNGFDFEFECTSESDTYTASLLANISYQVGVTFNQDTDELKHYLNGELKETDSTTSNCLTEKYYDIEIGGGSNGFNGNIDSLMVFDEILTENEINEIYVKGGFNASKTGWKTITTGNNQITEFNITVDTNYTWLEFNYSTDEYNFYSPILTDNIVVSSWGTTFDAVSDTCSYSSGTWNVDCADNCVISGDVTVDGSDIIMTGTGTFTINNNVKVTGWNYKRVDAECYYRGLGTGGFFQY